MTFQQKKYPGPGKGRHFPPQYAPLAVWDEEQQRYVQKGDKVQVVAHVRNIKKEA